MHDSSPQARLRRQAAQDAAYEATNQHLRQRRKRIALFVVVVGFLIPFVLFEVLLPVVNGIIT